jgi:hypothetical protein
MKGSENSARQAAHGLREVQPPNLLPRLGGELLAEQQESATVL